MKWIPSTRLVTSTNQKYVSCMMYKADNIIDKESKQLVEKFKFLTGIFGVRSDLHCEFVDLPELVVNGDIGE